ncbi:unnamed protein product, partial [marine sediment metagenome]
YFSPLFLKPNTNITVDDLKDIEDYFKTFEIRNPYIKSPGPYFNFFNSTDYDRDGIIQVLSQNNWEVEKKTLNIEFNETIEPLQIPKDYRLEIRVKNKVFANRQLSRIKIFYY